LWFQGFGKLRGRKVEEFNDLVFSFLLISFPVTNFFYSQ
jgi:hypothetical protein